MTAEEIKTDTVTTQENKPAQQTKSTVEEQINCLGCGKPIKKLKRYYRNGKYYCSKKCWRNNLKKAKVT